MIRSVKLAVLALISIVHATLLAQASQQRFEAASVTPAPPGVATFSMNGGPLPTGPFNQSGKDPGRITWNNVWLMRMIQVAYDFPVDRIGGPDWLNTQRYTLTATLPAATSVGDFRLMLQELLKERFSLAVHRETRQVSGYGLEVAKSGAKIKRSPEGARPEPKIDPTGPANALMITDQTGFPAPRPGNAIYPAGAPFEATISVNGRYRATVLNEPMAKIAEFLGRALSAPVEDETGLDGIYDLHLEYVPRPPAGAVADSDPGADVLDAVQQQLGLRLVAKKVPVETLAVDRAEKIPAAN